MFLSSALFISSGHIFCQSAWQPIQSKHDEKKRIRKHRNSNGCICTSLHSGLSLNTTEVRIKKNEDTAQNSHLTSNMVATVNGDFHWWSFCPNLRGFAGSISRRISEVPKAPPCASDNRPFDRSHLMIWPCWSLETRSTAEEVADLGLSAEKCSQAS